MVSTHSFATPGPDHLGQAVDVDRMHVEGLLDLGAHRVGPRLGAEDADLQRRFRRIDALRAEFVEDRQHVARRHGDHLGLEIDDQLHLALGHAARHRNRRAAELFGAVVQAEPAGEQPVAERHMHLHAAPAAARIDAARADVGPGLDVARRVADHGRLAGGAGRRMDAHDLVHRHREHAVGKIRPQVVLGGEREISADRKDPSGRPDARRRRRTISCSAPRSHRRASATTSCAATATPRSRRATRSRSG